MTYGVDRLDPFRRPASYVDRILKGEKAGDLPVQAPTKFNFTVNLNTAKPLELDLSPTFVGTADEVLE
jgi:putative ABC transport system substrate-binding protein